MNQRERDALDAHITGHYGEDQFPDTADHPFECWPEEPGLDACYECDECLANHPMGPSATTRSLRAYAVRESARAQVAAILGVSLDEID
jgi:hypothetical protein